MATEKKSNPWIKDLMVAFAGTTLSIILTFGTSALINHVNRNRDRKLTAMMVLSSIESSIRSLEESGTILARKDTVAHWLLDIPLADLKRIPDEVLLPPIIEVMTNYSVSTDKAIENIFSSNTDIWKNVGNFQFIDKVGKTYSGLRVVEDDLRSQMMGISDEYARIVEHPEQYPGQTLSEKILSNPIVRRNLEGIGKSREWLNYIAFGLRETNCRNMSLIDISEKEVMAFTDERSRPGEISAEDAANAAYFRGEFAVPDISPDSLFTMQDYTHLLDSVLAGRK